jgi:putative alpha-1,2-mannosidase
MSLFVTSLLAQLVRCRFICADLPDILLLLEKTLSIIALNQTAHNVYVQSVTWNGAALPDGVSTVRYGDLMQGGQLVFTMGATPFGGRH